MTYDTYDLYLLAGIACLFTALCLVAVLHRR